MNNKIDLETLIGFINKELSEEDSKVVQSELNKDPELTKKYNEFLKMNEMHEDYLNNILKQDLPEKTKKLFEESNIAKGGVLSFFKRGYVAIVGWMGFAVTGGLLFLPTAQMQLATRGLDDQQITIAGLEGNQETLFRGVNVKSLELEEVIIVDNKFAIKVVQIKQVEEEFCIEFSIKKLGESDNKFKSKSICLNN